jgi:archaellum component FlaC
MDAYPVESGITPVRSGLEDLWPQITGFATKFEQNLPTFDKSLDAYFDQSFASIIEEWELLTDSDLKRFENRLQAVTEQINILYIEKSNLEKRVNDLDVMISSLEKSV